jgi:hypothetical protein
VRLSPIGRGNCADVDLSSFLPQDKVADFAKLDPKRVLIETMRAAGDSRLSNWFTELCELGKERHGMENVSCPFHRHQGKELTE